MAFISKDPEKAKYLIRSIRTDGHKLQEFCDTKKQAKTFLKELQSKPARASVVVWQRVPTPCL